MQTLAYRRVASGITFTFAIGLVATFWLTRLLARFLFRVGATDPVIFGAVPIVLVVIAAPATLIPARRAARIDPERAPDRVGSAGAAAHIA